MLYLRNIVLFCLLLFSFLPTRSVQAISSQKEIPPTTFAYLENQQLADGGMPGLSGVSDPATTARALFVAKLHGIDPLAFESTDGLNLLDYLSSSYATYIVDDSGLIFPGNAGLMLTALAIFDLPPAGLSDSILSTLQPDGSFSSAAAKDFTTGAYTDLSQALAILGLAAAGTPVPPAALDYLISRQYEDGSWDNGFGSDPDTTAIVSIALLSSGQIDTTHPAVVKALEYFRVTQQDNGGWRPSWDTDPLNVDTTGWIGLALTTAGQDPENWLKNGSSFQEALLTQLKEDGSIGGTYVNVYSTLEALLGLATTPLLPVSAPVEAETTAPTIESQAGLVVTLPDGSSLLKCVAFSGESISGYDLLIASGLKVDTFMDPVKGPGVCSIEGQGCPASNCFCEMPNYWSYWHYENDTWAYSAVGAGTYEVKAGTVDGWGWGDKVLPPEIGFSEICGPNAQTFLPAVVTAPLLETVAPTIENTPSPTNAPVEKETAPFSTLNYLLFAGIVILLVVILFLSLRKKTN